MNKELKNFLESEAFKDIIMRLVDERFEELSGRTLKLVSLFTAPMAVVIVGLIVYTFNDFKTTTNQNYKEMSSVMFELNKTVGKLQGMIDG